MKKNLLTTLLLILSASLFAGEKEDAFKKAFMEAYKESDSSLYKLVEFYEGTPEMFDKGIKNSLSKMRTIEIDRIEFIEPIEEKSISFTHEGVEYTTTLPIEKLFKIHYKNTEVITVGSETSQLKSGMLNLGLKDGAYRIVAIKPKEAKRE